MSLKYNILRCKNGWITSDGTFIPCTWAGHERILKEMFNISSVDTDKMGWVKLSDGSGNAQGFNIQCYHPVKIKQAQIDTMFDWCKFNSPNGYAWSLFQKLLKEGGHE